MPKLATPEMFTAGPTWSLTGASSLLRVYWKRASLIERVDSVARLLTAIVWSRLFTFVPRLTELSPPTVRELSAEMS